MKSMIQIYNDGNVLSLIGGIKNDRFTARSIRPRGLLDVSVKSEEIGAVVRSPLFTGETIFDILFFLAREEFERLTGYDASERAFVRS